MSSGNGKRDDGADPRKEREEAAQSVHGIPISQNAGDGLKEHLLPEATVHQGLHHVYNSAEPVEGTMLYNEADIYQNADLKRFVLRGYQDVWAAVLFLLVTLMTIVWGIVNFVTYKGMAEPEVAGDMNIGAMIAVSIAVTAASVFGAILSLIVLAKYPLQLVYIANALNVVLCVVAAIVAFVGNMIFAGILLIVMAGLQVLWLYLVRNRIPFAAALLKLAADIISRYKAIVVCNFLLTIVYWVYIVLWGAMAVPTMDRIDDEAGAGDTVLLIFFMLVFFWAAQVIPNLMHVTTAGVVATWYFAGHAMMPRNPTLASFKRAITTSFGSICFGSLIVAVIRTLRWICTYAESNDNQFVRCIFLCILQCLENIVEYFNTYAFVHVAVYGCSYIEAAKRTWELCKQCFFAALFNDCLVGPTLMMLMLGVSAFIGVIVGVACFSLVVGAFAFFISLIVHSLFFTAVDSTVVTVFVCFAEHPAALQTASPDVYAALQEANKGHEQLNEDDSGGRGHNRRGYHTV